MNILPRLRLATLIVSSIGLAGTAAAQTGGPYDLRWNSIDGGGALSATAGNITIGVTIGQPDAGTQSGGSLVLDGGFWSVGVTGESPSPTATSMMPPPGTPTRAAVMAGDCTGTGTVTIADLIVLVNIALGNASPSACPQGIPNGEEVSIALIIQAVNNALTS